MVTNYIPVDQKITSEMSQAIHLLILNRFEGHKRFKEVASQLDITPQLLHRWKGRKNFQEEYDKQLAIYKSSFDDIRLADRRERIQAMVVLYNGLPLNKADLKLKILKEIRAECGDDHPLNINITARGAVAHAHQHQVQGLNLPPRDQDYDRWLKTNEKMRLTSVQEDGILPESNIEEVHYGEIHHGQSQSSGDENQGDSPSDTSKPLGTSEILASLSDGNGGERGTGSGD